MLCLPEDFAEILKTKAEAEHYESVPALIRELLRRQLNENAKNL